MKEACQPTPETRVIVLVKEDHQSTHLESGTVFMMNEKNR